MENQNTQNFVILEGRLTEDAKEKTINDTAKVKEFSLAVNSGKRTHFFDVAIWNKEAENFHGKKGELFRIEGKLQQDQWKDKDTGKSRSRVRVRAFEAQQIEYVKQIVNGEDNEPTKENEPSREPEKKLEQGMSL